MCWQKKQNFSAAKRDNHLLTPSLYLCCHERKSWKLTLAAVSICFCHLDGTNKTQQWIFTLSLSTAVLPLAHFTNQGPSKNKQKKHLGQGIHFNFYVTTLRLPAGLFNECSASLKQLMIWKQRQITSFRVKSSVFQCKFNGFFTVYQRLCNVTRSKKSLFINHLWHLCQWVFF